MSLVNQPDLSQRATLLNGVAAAFFSAAPYPRIIKTVLVQNSVPSSVSVYRGGSSNSVAIEASNSSGQNNTYSTPFILPAGQGMSVQWSAADSPASNAFAAISTYRSSGDSRAELDAALASMSCGGWSVNAVSKLTIPTNAGPTDPRVEVGGDIPANLAAYYASVADPGAIVAVTLYFDGQGNYQYDGLFHDLGVPPGQQVWRVFGGSINGVVHEQGRYLVNPGGALGNPDIIFSPFISLLVSGLAAVTGTLSVGPAAGSWIIVTRTAIADDALRILINGDSFDRLALEANGDMQWGNGAVSWDTSLRRSGVGTLAASPIVADIGPGTAETWHALSYSNGWSGASGGYRLVASPANTIQLTGALAIGTKADGTLVFTLPVGARPTTAKDISVAVNAIAGAAAQSPHFAVNTDGTVMCWGCSSATGNVGLNGSFPLDR